MQKINHIAFSIAVSILSGGLVLILSLWNVLTGFGEALIKLFISVHPTVFNRIAGEGFSKLISNLDFILINTAYALIDGFIAGFLLAILYNWLEKKFAARKEAPETPADES